LEVLTGHRALLMCAGNREAPIRTFELGLPFNPDGGLALRERKKLAVLSGCGFGKTLKANRKG